MKAEFHLQLVSKKQNKLLPEHSLRHYCYISSQNREFSDRLEFLLSVSKSLQIISIAQQSLSNIKQKKTNDFQRSGKKTKSDVITYITAARTTPQQCVFPAVVWRTPLKPQERKDIFTVRPQISKHKDHTQKIKNTMQNNQPFLP